MYKKINREQLEILKQGVLIYSPFLLYFFLKQLELSKSNHYHQIINDAEANQIFDAITGIPLKQWPAEIKEDYSKLSKKLLSSEQFRDLFAETHYYLIFLIASHSANYTDRENQKIILDHLFTIFEDRELWKGKYPENNAFNKYRESKNSIEEFIRQISKISKESDAWLLAELATHVSSIFKFLIRPGIDELFSQK